MSDNDQLAELIRKAGQDARDADAEAGYRCGFDTDRFIADAIIAAGWRAPEPIKFGRWYRTLLPDGSTWAETSDPAEGYLAHTDPTVPLTWERITVSGAWVDWPDHPTDLVHPATLAGDDEHTSTDDYKAARGAVTLNRPAEQIIREGRGDK